MRISQVFTETIYGEPKTNWRWWSERRLAYNLALFPVGVTTWLLVLVAGGASVKPGVDFEEPFAMILGPPIYALLANLCYTAGPILDRQKSRPNLPLFKVGFWFSVSLTALPGIWALYCWITSIITGQLRD